MIESEAEVLRLEGQHAWVRIKPHTPCGNCDPETGCKTVAMTRMFTGGKQEFRVRNPIAAGVGDLVKVVIADGVLLQSALWGYGFPLCLIMLGGGAGFAISPPDFVDLATLGGAVLGAAVALLLLRKRQQFLRVEPEISEKRLPGIPIFSSCKNKSNS